tara:strand:+ start:105 stop:866 length:762 start_codon:yes stop_codon:yes gene_type:complete
MGSVFWYNDISVLYDVNNLLEFIPLKNYDFTRKLNAVVRLSIYYSIIAYLFSYNKDVLCVPFIVLVATVFLFKNSEKKLPSNLNMYRKSNNINTSNNVDKLVDTPLLNNTNGTEMMYGINNNSLIEGFSSIDNSVDINYKFNQYENIPKSSNKEVGSCSIPTVDNPFMNLNTYDYSNGPVSKACQSYDNKNIQNMIENQFNNDLFLDSNDLFGRRNSQRQYYTMPNTEIPNGQDKFMNWLYNIGDRERKKNWY